jgi:hypothetical protein
MTGPGVVSAPFLRDQPLRNVQDFGKIAVAL